MVLGSVSKALSGLGLCCLLAAAWPEEPWTLARPKPAVALTPARVEQPESIACAACHAAVVEEWAESAHALAWVDREYQEALADIKRPEGCHGCHAPQPLFQQKDPSAKPPARTGERMHGITCESCHLAADGAMLGPHGSPSSAHASRRSEAFVGAGSDALCASCHRVTIGPVVGVAKDFEQSKQAERGRSCVGCHCATVELEFTRDTTQPAAATPAAKRTGRSHLLQTPRDPSFLRQALRFELLEEQGATVVVVHNRAGHRVPGLTGRKLTLEFRALAADGKELARKSLVIDVGQYLPVDGQRKLALGVAAAEVRVRGLHEEPRAVEAVVFVDETLKR